ncbi:hypothetical protein BLA60_26570 [Actinophytocola xinjiangensis]|uniref:Uncharacterized protein n=1 Tax=Actinophytocola xinjiangensis TaxID=485602 RepID=A0A7Z1AWB2_9PSEU|nr:hypothetical protein BLA60_26570 [Actinophytocola xinjiangensis]
MIRHRAWAYRRLGLLYRLGHGLAGAAIEGHRVGGRPMLGGQVGCHLGQRDIGHEPARNDRGGGTDGQSGKRTGDLTSERGTEDTTSGEPSQLSEEIAPRPGSLTLSRG